MVGHLHHRRLQHHMLRASGGFLAALLMLVSATAVLADPPPGNGASCVNFHCGVGATDPGSAGSPGAGAPPSVPPISGIAADASSANHTSGSGADTGGGTVSVPACTEQPMSPQPAPTSPWWEGQTSAAGLVVQWVCTGGTTPSTCTYCSVLVPHFAASGAAAAPGVPPAAPAPPPPPDPAVLAQQAYQQIPIPKPDMHFGPHPDLVAVNIPVWLWVSKVQVAPVTVAAGGVSVTATPALRSVSWSMGEPVDPSNPGVLAPPVVCSGDAMYTPAPTDVAPTVPPACGYSYQWRSLKARTGGLGSWAVSASATWAITWTSNVGQGGTITAPPANSVANLQVGEWQTIGVYAGSESGG